jgi:DNA-binding GntR family transcriptional regulator
MEQVMKETRHTQAYDWILNKILNDNCPPGTPMKEEKLAEEIGISATPVREALRQLEREGWLETIPYRGCFIKQYTASEIEELTILRESVEVASVKKFIELATPEDFERLNDVMRRSDEVVARIEKDEISELEVASTMRQLDTEFHHYLVAGTHCERIIQHAKIWNQQLHRYALQSFLDEHNANSEPGKKSASFVVRQHKAIILALEMKWTSAALELLSAHISGTFAILRAVKPQ